MRIKKILGQHRRDFSAILACGFCGAEMPLAGGYDDKNFHGNVIPSIRCESCGKDEPITLENRVLAPFYPDYYEI